MTNLAMYHRPTLRQRFWRSVGFRYHLHDLDDDPALPGWMMTETKIEFSVADRIRLLLTGRLHLTLRQATNVEVDHARSAMSFRIGHPGESK